MILKNVRWFNAQIYMHGGLQNPLCLQKAATTKIKWNEWGFRQTFVHREAKLGQENLLRMVRWMRWHCPPPPPHHPRHWIQNSSPGGLRPSTPPLGHWGSPQYKIFTIGLRRSLKHEVRSVVRTRDLQLSKQADLTIAPGPLSYTLILVCLSVYLF